MVDCWLLVAIYIVPLYYHFPYYHYPIYGNPHLTSTTQFGDPKRPDGEDSPLTRFMNTGRQRYGKDTSSGYFTMPFLPPIWLGMVAIGSHTTNQKMLGDSKHDIVLPAEIEPTWCETSNGETHDYTWIHWFAGYKRLNILDGRDSTNNLLTTLK